MFQTLEPGHRISFGVGLLDWEFHDGIRSYLLPGFVAGIMNLTEPLSSGSIGYLVGCFTALALLSTAPMVLAAQLGWRNGGPSSALVATAICAAWFELVYFGSKALSEVVAGHLLVFALTLHYGSPSLRGRGIALGALLGLVLVLRVHFVPAIAVIFCACCRPRDASLRRPPAAGFIVALLLGGALDWITWGLPFQSVWKNVVVNVFEGKASQSGTAPWYHFFQHLPAVWQYATIPIVGLGLIGARRFPLLLMVALAVLVPHSVVAHKEYRFIYIAIALFVVLAAVGNAHLCANLPGRRRILVAAFSVALWGGPLSCSP